MFANEKAEAKCRELDAAEGELAELVGILNATHGRIVEVVGRALEQDLWQGWGIHSPAHWLGWKCGMAPMRARQVVKLAERRNELPLASAALVAGELSLDQAAEIALHVPAAFDEAVTEFARLATVTQLRRTLPQYAFEEQLAEQRRDADSGSGSEDEPAPTPAPKPIEERREFSMGTDDRGWWLNGHLPVDEGAVVEAAIRAARDDLYRQACDGLDPEVPRPAVGLVDGLLGVAEASLRAGEAAHPGSGRYLVHAHLEAGPGDDPTGIAALHLGPILPRHLRRLLTCDATLRPVLERDGVPANVGRDERIVPRRIRRLIEQRDGGCAVPGCHRRTGLQIHHITHWEDGGETDTRNLVTVCAAHHRAHHCNLLGIVNADHHEAPHGLRFTDRWGRPLDPAGRPVTPHPTRIDAAVRNADIAPGSYHHPLGERLDTTAVIFYPTRPPTPPQPPEAEPDPVSGPPPTVAAPPASWPPNQPAAPPTDSLGREATPPRAGPTDQESEVDRIEPERNNPAA